MSVVQYPPYPMQYPYTISELKPLNICVDEDGTTHAVYNLPAPKRWQIRHLHGTLYSEPTKHTVSRVRVAIGFDEFTRQPFAVAVPYDEYGQEHPFSSVHFMGACSLIAVLSRLGFEPILSTN